MLANLSDRKLCARLEKLVRHERKIMAVVIEHIAEMEKRKLYLALGYRSLFDYLTKKLEYSESSAYRRMQAARALLQVPEIKPHLEAGSLKLSQITLVQKTLRQEEKVFKKQISLQERKEIFTAVAGKTGEETEKLLDQKVSVPLPQKMVAEKHRRDDSVELHLRLPKELYGKLKRVKELYSHIEPGADWIKLIELMAEDVIKKRDPLAKKPRRSSRWQELARLQQPIVSQEPSVSQESESPQEPSRSQKSENLTESNRAEESDEPKEAATRRFCKKRKPGGKELSSLNRKRKPSARERRSAHRKRRPIPAEVKRLVLVRDQGECQYVGKDGKKCRSRYQPQLNHITPVFLGGDNSLQNLRVLCREHNVFRFQQSGNQENGEADRQIGKPADRQTRR